MSRHDNHESSTRAMDPELIEFGDDRLDATQKAVRSAAFLNLLDIGRPTNTTDVARRAETPVEVANQTIHMLAKQGSAHLDGDGDLLGIAGLSVEPTKHMIALPHGENVGHGAPLTQSALSERSEPEPSPRAPLPTPPLSRFRVVGSILRAWPSFWPTDMA